MDISVLLLLKALLGTLYSNRLFQIQTDRENVGLLGTTRVGSRRVIQISAGFMIFFSILGEQRLYWQSS